MQPIYNEKFNDDFHKFVLQDPNLTPPLPRIQPEKPRKPFIVKSTPKKKGKKEGESKKNFE